MKLKRKFRNSKLRDYTDPDEWITDLEEIQSKVFEIDESRTQNHISNEDIMISVINGLLKAYDIERNELEKDLENDTLDMTELRLKLATIFERIKDKEEHENDDKEESAMTRQDKAPTWKAKKKFKGRCYNCGKYGHKDVDYKGEKKQNNNRKSTFKRGKKFNGNCNHCGKKVTRRKITSQRREKKKEPTSQMTKKTWS